MLLPPAARPRAACPAARGHDLGAELQRARGDSGHGAVAFSDNEASGHADATSPPLAESGHDGAPGGAKGAGTGIVTAAATRPRTVPAPGVAELLPAAWVARSRVAKAA
jgi:hypothetical protein